MKPTDIVGDDVKSTDWADRLDTPRWSFGKSDGSFGDVVSVTHDADLTTADVETLLWGFGILLRKEVYGAFAHRYSKGKITEFILAEVSFS